MSENKKYYWLRLKDDFFGQKEIKKLRSIAGGDTYTIIYLKLQLLSLCREGRLVYDGIEETFISEMALEIDEPVDNVGITIAFLEKHGLLESSENEDEFLLPEAISNMGKITSEGVRKRAYRERIGARDTVPLLSQNRPPEKEKEKEKEKEFIIPSLEEVKALVKENGYTFNPEHFYKYYDSNDWRYKDGKKMKNLKQAMVTWQFKNKPPTNNPSKDYMNYGDKIK